jgi:DNA-binding FrmR family transcriptional regulator
MTEPETEEELRKRLRRIEGQVQGVLRMLDADRECVEILTQVRAIRAALAQVSFQLGERHIRKCIVADLDAHDPRVPAMREVLRLCGS